MNDILKLVTAIETYMKAEQEFANDGEPDNYAAYRNSEIQLRVMLDEIKNGNYRRHK